MTTHIISPKSIWCFYKEESLSDEAWEATFMQYTGDDIPGSNVSAAGFVIDKANYLVREPYEECDLDTGSVTSANRLRIAIPFRFNDGGTVSGKYRGGPLFIGELWTYNQLTKMKLWGHWTPTVHHVIDSDPWTDSCGSEWEYHSEFGKGRMISNYDGVVASVFQKLHDDAQMVRTWKGCFTQQNNHYSPRLMDKCEPPVKNKICDRCAYIRWPGHGVLVRKCFLVGSGELMFTGQYYVYGKNLGPV